LAGESGFDAPPAKPATNGTARHATRPANRATMKVEVSWPRAVPDGLRQSIGE
jgi:hypothetical protein